MSAPELSWDAAVFGGGGWQGIRYLELVSPTLVHVHLAEPATGFTAEHVRVTGPEPIAYSVAFPVEDDHRIDLSFTDPGGHGPWYVSLEPAPGVVLHPFFCLASFVFAIDCEAGDCRPSTDEAELEPAAEPELDLLSKDYAGLLTLLADRIRVSNRAWADLSPASFERVLVELLAHHGDMLSYHQDRVAAEAFIDTASQRFSLTQHAVLLGQTLREPEAATCLLAVSVSEGGELPAGVQVRMPRRPDEAAVVFTISESRWVDPSLDADDLRVAQWPGAFTATIPAGASSLLLWGHHEDLRVDERLALVSGTRSEIVEIAGVELVELPGWVVDPNLPLTMAEAELTRVTLREPLTRAWTIWDEAEPLRIHGNLVEARAGALRRAVLPTADSGPLQRDDVRVRPSRRNAIVTRDGREGTPRFLLRALRVPEAPLLWDRDEDGEQVPAVELEIDGERWLRQPHLHRSRAYDRHYSVSSDNDGGVWLHFGDDRRGRGVVVNLDEDQPIDEAVPELELVLRYRVGQASAGNIALAKLTEVVPPSDPESLLASQLAALGTLAIVNVSAATGGREAETLDAIRESMTAGLRDDTLQRAVTLADYAAVAEQADARVERAAARALGGVFNTVLVLVDERDAEVLSEDLRETIQGACDRLRMTGREVVVRGPDYVALDVHLALCAELGVQRHRLRERILAALRPGSDAAPGWFHPDRLSFGEDLELGDLLAFVQRLPGVRSVKALSFRRLRDPSSTAVFDRIAFEPSEVARLDADDLRPENGRLRVDVVGLDQSLDLSAWDIEQPAAQELES